MLPCRSLHTAHFSIGSGTKLALEDSIALFECLERTETVGAALREFESGEIKFISIHTDEVAVHAHENTAVVTGRGDVHWRFGGEERREHLKFMHVFVKRDRRWVLVAQQLTRIARPL